MSGSEPAADATAVFSRPSQSPPASQQGPGDYTRIFAAPSSPSPAPQTPAAKAVPKPAAVGKKKASYLPLVLILVALLVLAAGLIMFFALQGD
jgi:hypothetical protein